MNNNEKKVAIKRAELIFNGFMLFTTALCVGMVAIGTGSLHCFWGLIFLGFMLIES